MPVKNSNIKTKGTASQLHLVFGLFRHQLYLKTNTTLPKLELFLCPGERVGWNLIG
jgi:hypothetical protein